MHKYLALFILVTFFAQTFSNVFVVADYFFNTGSFAKNCENKAHPAMHCNGKCQMMKKLQQQNKEEQNTERKYQNKNEVLSSKSFFPEVLFTINSTAKIYSNQKTSALINRSLDIFHPPQMLY